MMEDISQEQEIPNEWICREIKGPIDLTKVDITFFTGGLAEPILQEQEIPITYDYDLDEAEEEDEDETKEPIEFDVDEFEE
jgi:hypothetical protein